MNTQWKPAALLAVVLISLLSGRALADEPDSDALKLAYIRNSLRDACSNIKSISENYTCKTYLSEREKDSMALKDIPLLKKMEQAGNKVRLIPYPNTEFYTLKWASNKLRLDRSLQAGDAAKSLDKAKNIDHEYAVWDGAMEYRWNDASNGETSINSSSKRFATTLSSANSPYFECYWLFGMSLSESFELNPPTFIGIEKTGDDEIYIVELIRNVSVRSTHLRLYLDSKRNCLPVKEVVYTIDAAGEGSPDNPSVLKTFYDYRQSGGSWLPHKIEIKSFLLPDKEARSTRIVELLSVEVNGDMPDEAFSCQTTGPTGIWNEDLKIGWNTVSFDSAHDNSRTDVKSHNEMSVTDK